MARRRRTTERPSATTASSKLSDPARAARARYLEHQIRKLEETAEAAIEAGEFRGAVQARSKGADLRDDLEKLRALERDRKALARRKKRTVEAFDPGEPEPVRMKRRVTRLYQQIAAAEASGNHQAVASLMRQASMAEAEFARALGPAEPGAGDLTEADEEQYLAELRASAEEMPESHLRVLADAWLERHRMTAIPRDL